MKPELQNGDVVLVTFPFTDLAGTKLRPAVIISSEEVHQKEGDYTLLFISSVIPDSPEKYEFIFPESHSDFRKSGLKKESVFKANKITTLQKQLIQRKLGVLGEEVRAELRKIFQHALRI
ncbi:MAG: type II toxin-antitoxin system PemK/MazF family toxin [Deltaproteobacteria bacterium]|nr:type II toxin-antitoxin system PemK/MazF family toxin [Deltaproteobacteria bacterium]